MIKLTSTEFTNLAQLVTCCYRTNIGELLEFPDIVMYVKRIMNENKFVNTDDIIISHDTIGCILLKYTIYSKQQLHIQDMILSSLKSDDVISDFFNTAKQSYAEVNLNSITRGYDQRTIIYELATMDIVYSSSPFDDISIGSRINDINAEVKQIIKKYQSTSMLNAASLDDIDKHINIVALSKDIQNTSSWYDIFTNINNKE